MDREIHTNMQGPMVQGWEERGVGYRLRPVTQLFLHCRILNLNLIFLVIMKVSLLRWRCVA